MSWSPAFILSLILRSPTLTGVMGRITPNLVVRHHNYIPYKNIRFLNGKIKTESTYILSFPHPTHLWRRLTGNLDLFTIHFRLFMFCPDSGRETGEIFYTR